MGSRSSALFLVPLLLAAAPQGVFEGQQDVGAVLHSGSVEYDPGTGTYTVSGSGDNMWFAADAFHFVWKKMSGDVTLSADISILGEAGDPHRKAVLMIRQTLDPDSAYADVALHGNGLTSLQVREENGDATHEIESNITAPRRVSIIKQGDIFRIVVDGQMAGGSMRANVTGTYYMGIGVCAHKKDFVQKAAFSNVATGKPDLSAPKLYSTIETINVASTDRRVVYVTEGRLTAPTWTPDGNMIEFMQDGHPRSVSAAGGQPSGATGAEPESYLSESPDGKQLAWVSRSDGEMMLRAMSFADKTIRVLAKGKFDRPAWSTDSRRLVFVSYQMIN